MMGSNNVFPNAMAHARKQSGLLLNPFRFGGGGGATFPVVESSAHSSGGTGSFDFTFNVAMPSGIVAGDFLVCVVRSNPISSHTAGWTLSTFNVSGNISVLYKVASGGDTLSITQSQSFSTGPGASVFRISNADSIQIGYGWSSSTSQPDTPAVTPAGGPRDYLGMSCVATFGNASSVTATSYPAGYNDYTRSSAVGSNRSVVHCVNIQENTSTIDPSPWTLSSAVFLMWCTLAIWKS